MGTHETDGSIMSGQYADGVYGRKPWNEQPQEYIGPFTSNHQRLTTQAMASITMNSEDIQLWVRPNLPQIEMFPDKYGYTQKEYGIEDIIELTGRAVTRKDFSGEPTTTESTSRNTLGQV
jgi:hypothetical protein